MRTTYARVVHFCVITPRVIFPLSFRARAVGAGTFSGTAARGGRVRLSDRQLRVRKPRLRRKGKGRGKEVEIPAYEANQAEG